MVRKKCSLCSSVLVLFSFFNPPQIKKLVSLFSLLFLGKISFSLPCLDPFLHPGHTSLTVHFLGSQIDGVPISKASQKWIGHLFTFAV